MVSSIRANMSSLIVYIWLACAFQLISGSVNHRNVIHRPGRIGHSKEEIESTNDVLLDPNNEILMNAVKEQKPLIIIIRSLVDNFDKRQDFRQRLSEFSTDLPHFFVVGTSNDRILNHNFKIEVQEFDDLVQADIIDSIFNITLKDVFILRQLNDDFEQDIHISQVFKYVLIVDDDSLINVDNLIQFLEQIKDQTIEKSLFCNVLSDMEPDRNDKALFYIPKYIFQNDSYPHFCSGSFLMTTDSIDPLTQMAIDEKTQPKLRLNDVFITGIAAEAAGIKRINSSLFMVKNGLCSDDDMVQNVVVSHCFEEFKNPNTFANEVTTELTEEFNENIQDMMFGDEAVTIRQYDGLIQLDRIDDFKQLFYMQEILKTDTENLLKMINESKHYVNNIMMDEEMFENRVLKEITKLWVVVILILLPILVITCYPLFSNRRYFLVR